MYKYQRFARGVVLDEDCESIETSKKILLDLAADVGWCEPLYYPYFRVIEDYIPGSIKVRRIDLLITTEPGGDLGNFYKYSREVNVTNGVKSCDDNT